MSRREPVYKYEEWTHWFAVVMLQCAMSLFISLPVVLSVPGLKNRYHSFCDGCVLVWQASATCSKKTELFNSGSLLSTAITRLKVFGCSYFRNCAELSGCSGYFRACNLLKQNPVWPIHPFHAAVSGCRNPCVTFIPGFGRKSCLCISVVLADCASWRSCPYLFQSFHAISSAVGFGVCHGGHLITGPCSGAHETARMRKKSYLEKARCTNVCLIL